MKLYIAAAFTRNVEVEHLYSVAARYGHSVAYDWTVHRPIQPYEANVAEAAMQANNCLRGMIDCDVFVMLSDTVCRRGVFVELGAAIMLSQTRGKPRVFIVGDFLGDSVFCFHPAVERKETFEQVLMGLDNRAT